MSEIALLRMLDDLQRKINRLETAQAIGPQAVWDDLPPNAVSVGAGASAPSFTAYNGNLRAYEFVGAAITKEIHMQWQLSHSWLEGSTIYPHIHLYIPAMGAGGDIKFSCEYTWINVDAAEGATTTINNTLTVGLADGTRHKILALPAVVGTGKTLSSIFSARIYRDPTDVADTFGLSVWLKAADLHRQIDSLGSRQEYAK